MPGNDLEEKKIKNPSETHLFLYMVVVAIWGKKKHTHNTILSFNPLLSVESDLLAVLCEEETLFCQGPGDHSCVTMSWLIC